VFDASERDFAESGVEELTTREVGSSENAAEPAYRASEYIDIPEGSSRFSGSENEDEAFSKPDEGLREAEEDVRRS
jgi:hypothetical protein